MERARLWRDRASAEFVEAYHAHAAGSAVPEDPHLSRALLRLFLVQKAIYEIDYELGNRPAWVGIPLRGVLDLVAQDTE
jgi:maltose alpha-D-glucosyltransferase/alpha-amylase